MFVIDPSAFGRDGGLEAKHRAVEEGRANIEHGLAMEVKAATAKRLAEDAKLETQRKALAQERERVVTEAKKKKKGQNS